MKIARRLSLIASLLFCLSACAFSSPPEPTRYQLQPVAMAPMAQVSAETLRVDAPRATTDIDSDRIQLQHADGTVDFIANAAWNVTPDHMLGPLMLQALAKARLFRAVADDSSTVDAAFELQSSLERFAVIEASDSGNAATNVEIALRIDLIRAADNTLVLSHRLVATAPVTGPLRMTSIIAAFNTATADLLNQLASTLATGVKLPHATQRSAVRR